MIEWISKCAKKWLCCFVCTKWWKPAKGTEYGIFCFFFFFFSSYLSLSLILVRHKKMYLRPFLRWEESKIKPTVYEAKSKFSLILRRHLRFMFILRRFRSVLLAKLLCNLLFFYLDDFGIFSIKSNLTSIIEIKSLPWQPSFQFNRANSNSLFKFIFDKKNW